MDQVHLIVRIAFLLYLVVGFIVCLFFSVRKLIQPETWYDAGRSIKKHGCRILMGLGIYVLVLGASYLLSPILFDSLMIVSIALIGLGLGLIIILLLVLWLLWPLTIKLYRD